MWAIVFDHTTWAMSERDQRFWTRIKMFEEHGAAVTVVHFDENSSKRSWNDHKNGTYKTSMIFWAWNSASFEFHFDWVKHKTVHQSEPDLLLEPGLVKHSVFEVHRVSVASELHKITHCADTQAQLQLWSLYHRAGGLKIICHHRLHTNTGFMFAWL